MPHIIVKLLPGRTEEQKRLLAEAISSDVVRIAKCDASLVSVSVEEVEATEWPEKVYMPDILNAESTLYKKPGYNPFE